VSDLLRIWGKQQNSQWEIHEYVDLLNFVLLHTLLNFILISILYVEHISD